MSSFDFDGEPAAAAEGQAEAESDEELLDELLPLPALLDEAQQLFRAVEAGGLKDADAAVERALHLLDRVAQQVRSLALFSGNEHVDDVNTTDLRFLLVDWLRAKLVPRRSSISTRDPHARLAVLKQSQQLHTAFLRQCDSLNLLQGDDAAAWQAFCGDADREEEEDEEELPTAPQQPRPPRNDPATDRARKIARFKQERADAERLAELEQRMAAVERRRHVDDPCPPGVDEELLRELTLLKVASGVRQALDDLDAYGKEVEILKFMASRSPPNEPRGAQAEDDRDGQRRRGRDLASDPARPGLQVTHMTRGEDGSLQVRKEQLKSEVFRPGHRLPTMSIEELAEIEVAAAMERSRKAEQPRSGPRRIKQLEEDGEEDNPELVEQAAYKDRAWDQWKEENPKGSGNKANKRF